MLQDDTDAIRGLGYLGDNPLLDIGESTSAGGFTSSQYNDRAARFVICRIEPISQIKEAIRVRLVLGVIMEMVDRRREIVGRVGGSDLD